MKIVAFLVLLFALVLGDTTLKIATYNVENLFDLEKNGYEYPEYIPNTNSDWNAQNYKIKLQNITKVIQDMNADIIAIEEIESLEALKDLKYALKQKGLYYPYFNIADSKNTTTKVAILSKIPFIYSKELSVTASFAQRNILETKFTINNKDLYIFINHWKAKSGPESKRIVSAKALVNRIKQIGYDKNIILMGDFNSDYEENVKFLRKRKLNDTNGKTGINDVLKSAKQQQKASQVKYEENSFYNLWYDTDSEERYTYIFRGKKEAIDNILISQSLLNKKEIFYISDTISAYKPPYLFQGKQIYRWQTTRKKPTKHIGKGYSDHLPLVAKIQITD